MAPFTRRFLGTAHGMAQATQRLPISGRPLPHAEPGVVSTSAGQARCGNPDAVATQRSASAPIKTRMGLQSSTLMLSPGLLSGCWKASPSERAGVATRYPSQRARRNCNATLLSGCWKSSPSERVGVATRYPSQRACRNCKETYRPICEISPSDCHCVDGAVPAFAS